MGQVREPAGIGVVIVDSHRLASHPDATGDAVAALRPVAEEVGEDPRPDADDEGRFVGLDHVQEAMGRPHQPRGPVDDRLEQLGRIEAVHERQRGFVECREIGIAGLVDRVYLLETGSLVREGPADKLLKDQALLESYLG